MNTYNENNTALQRLFISDYTTELVNRTRPSHEYFQ